MGIVFVKIYLYIINRSATISSGTKLDQSIGLLLVGQGWWENKITINWSKTKQAILSHTEPVT